MDNENPQSRPPRFDTLDRMVRAVERVRQRLLQSTAALASAGVTAPVIGGNAVAFWVTTVDPSAVRNTPNVDLLLDRSDADAARSALVGAGFAPQGIGDRPAVFIDGPDIRLSQAVRLWFTGDKLGASIEPLPDVTYSLPTIPFRVVALPTLIRMKLDAYRTIDRVHLRDMASVGLIDDSWCDGLPPRLADRLREILADPDG